MNLAYGMTYAQRERLLADLARLAERLYVLHLDASDDLRQRLATAIIELAEATELVYRSLEREQYG